MNAAARAKIVERQLNVWYLRQEGATEAKIAATLGVNRAVVIKDLDAVTNRLMRRMESMAERIKLEQTYQLQHVLSEAMEAWEASKKPAKRNTTKQYQQPTQLPPPPNGANVPTNQAAIQMQLTSAIHTLSTSDRTGNVEYLNVALQTMEQLRKLWGIGMQEGEVNNYVLPVIREVRLQPPSSTDIPSLSDGNIIDVIPNSDGNEAEE